jgi:hypothetical protein
MKHLTGLRNQVKDLSKLTYQMWGIPLHPSYGELKLAKDQYMNEINATKKQHWQEWLEDIEGNDLWTANKYILLEPWDGGKTHVPSLTTTNSDGTITEAVTNHEKSEILARSFFPPPPNADSIPPDVIYPGPVKCLSCITSDQLKRAINHLSGYKAPGPDGICNIIFKECADTLIPYLLFLFNAVFTHCMYYQPWRSFSTVVLQKPGKPNYSIPKAYHPIALLNTMGKLLTAVVANQLTYILEHHQLLLNTLWGVPGQIHYWLTPSTGRDNQECLAFT